MSASFFSAVVNFPDGRVSTCRVYVGNEGDPAVEESIAALDLIQMVTQSVYESGCIEAQSGHGCIGVVEA